jgi:subtilase family serine protease
MFRKPGLPAVFVLMTCALGLPSAGAQSRDIDMGEHSAPRIRENVDDAKRITLHGNSHHRASEDNDRGKVDDDLRMHHLLLQLRRSPQQEKAVEKFIEQLQDANSPEFHKWLTAEEFGEKFGVSRKDLETVTHWLRANGLHINVVYPSGMVIDFSGSAEQVARTFGTEIHYFEVDGQTHIANANDPQIPATLAPVVAGVVSLHDFWPRSMHVMRSTPPNFTFNGLYGATYAVVPGDLATIYNLNPLFSAGYSGQGQTIALIEDSDVFSSADWKTFRSRLGLSGYTSGSFRTVHPAAPSGPNNCSRPGVIAPNDAEAILDAEWASAAAPSAAVEIISCADTTTTFGGLIAMENLLNSSRPPAIMSVSYGQCETENGAAANAAYNSVYQQAVAEGVSVFVAAGDSGAAGCDNSVSEATHGVGANAFASTPYNVAVGGTDFSDTYSGTNGIYWNSTNNSNFASAGSYVPEIPWNDSCAGSLLSTFVGFSPTYGLSSLCNDAIYGGFFQTTVAGGGSPSACATGVPSIAGVVSGSCQGWAKPSWQNVVGNPNDGVRDTPDVSLFAADGLWNHYYVFCWSDTKHGGTACTGNPSGWSGAGGTSFAAPIMAGIQALVNQKVNARQGNPNPVYYQLARAEYGSSGSSACNSSNGNGVASTCVFYDVTQGDMDVNCTGNANCYDPSGAGTQGVLSTSNNSFSPAFGTTTGWDFATGIGSLNAANLVANWPTGGLIPGFSLSTSPNSVTLTQGSNGTSTITVNPLNGFSSSVSFSVSGLPSGVTASFNPASSTNTSAITFSSSSSAAVGTSNVTVTGISGILTSTTSISLTVNPVLVANFTLSATPDNVSIVQGASGTSTINVVPQNGFNGSVSLSATGLPSGVTASFNPANSSGTSTLTLTASGTATTGAATVTIIGTAGTLTNSTTVSLTVSQLLVANFTLSASPSSLTIVQGASGTSTIGVAPQNGFNGSVTLSASGLPSGVTASFNPASTSGASTLTLTASDTATLGAASIAITGTSGSLTNATTLALTINGAPGSTLPSVWLDSDIGSTGVAGSATYKNNVFTVTGSGAEIYDSADAFHFVYQPLSGDGTITARLVSLQGASSSASTGVMIRDTLDPASANAKTADWPAYSGIFFDIRPASGGGTSEPGSASNTALPYWLRVSRSGSTFSSFTSLDGVNWVQLGTSQTATMGSTVYVGLAVTSGSTAGAATATFDNVSVNASSAPAPAIASVSATTGTTGSQVVINGSNFASPQANSAVLLNGLPMILNSWTSTSITSTVPAGATSGPLVVSVAPTMNDSNPVVFTVTPQPLPTNWLDQDVGAVGVGGNASYTSSVFTVQGAGAQIYGNADGFHFVYQLWPSDGTITARLVALQGTSNNASAGVMIRGTLGAGSANAKTGYWPAYSGIFFDVRPAAGGGTSEPGSMSGITLPYWIKVTRSGNTFSSYASTDGVAWIQLGATQTVTMGQIVDVGLVVTSGNTSALATGTFDNVSITP